MLFCYQWGYLMLERKISVILNSYNRPDMLKKALLSINSQSYVPDEVIITDDGSKVDIVEGISEILPLLNNFKLKFIRQQDAGFRLAKCRNNAIRIAEGDFLIFWDQDILAAKNYIKTFCDNLREGGFLIPPDPVRLTEQQSNRITDEMIIAGDYGEVITKLQLANLRRLVRKDKYYYFETRFIKKNSYKPKVRGGIAGIFKKDILKIDGYDENYIGWGFEDDDLGRRLYKSGITGKNVFDREFSVHLFHPTNTTGEESVNYDYYNKRIAEIKAGDFKAVRGLSNPLGDDEPEIKRLV
jgi:glycosyltransferase involved in cell wall biosynthesis